MRGTMEQWILRTCRKAGISWIRPARHIQGEEEEVEVEVSCTPQ